MSTYIVKTDGSCMPNPGDMGIGVVIFLDDIFMIKKVSQYIGYGTNNIAEYKAFIRGLEEIKRLKRPEDDIEIYIDSVLIYKQTKGEWRVKNQELKPLCERAKELMEELTDIVLLRYGREENSEADSLAKGAIISERSKEKEEGNVILDECKGISKEEILFGGKEYEGGNND